MTEPTIEATLACGDTISVRTAPAVGAYRLCIHCDSRKRVTAVTDHSQPAASLPAEAERGQQEDGAHCTTHGPTGYAQGEDDFASFTGYAGGRCYAARLLCGCWDVDETNDVRAAR